MHTCPQCASSCDSSHRFCPQCGFPISEVAKTGDDPLIGTTLPGGYVILELTGIGGMGRVYRAEQTALGRTVAVKIVHPHLAGDENASARFITEARTSSRLNHPNSVAVIDFGKTDAGLLYLVMEYLRGRDLARVAHENGPLPFRRVIDILRQVLAALSEAHHIGIIHRDLKPENIVIEPMRTGGDFVKVVDFGLAKMLVNTGGPSITSAGVVCGTPDYMAPEQGRGDPLDARSDLYAVGVILFQLLTGRLPFEAESPTQVVLMHLTVPPPDPREVAPSREIPASLAMIALSALSKDPHGRYQSADAFADALASTMALMDSVPPRLSSSPGIATIACAECGAIQPRGQRFCGDCGARISWTGKMKSIPAADMRAPEPASVSHPATTPSGELPLTSRDDDITWLLDRQAETTTTSNAIRIVGEPGMGKTRLVREFLDLGTDSEFVVQAAPDPYWADICNFTLQRLIQDLADLPQDGGDATAWFDADEDVQAVLVSIFRKSEHVPRSSIPPESCRRSQANALRWALRRAASRTQQRVTVFIDEYHRVDGASRNAVADIVGEPVGVPALIIVAHVPGFDAKWPGTSPARTLGGFTPELAANLVRGTTSGEALKSMEARGVPPMYVEQVARFMQEGGTAPPPRLADLVALRIARLKQNERRVLQAVAVLGDYTSNDNVRRLVDSETDVETSVGRLVAAGMLIVSNGTLVIAHPLVREIAEVTIPAGARRDLHEAASGVSAELRLPIEVRAMHAFKAQDSLGALLLLEQVGGLALSYDDIDGAVLAFRRGLEVARREIFRGEIDDPMQAVLIFSRKLGEALTRAGDLTDADGVLREAINLAPPTGEDRAKVLFALARVARARQRSPDAVRYLSEAIDLAHNSGARELLASLEEALHAWAS